MAGVGVTGQRRHLVLWDAVEHEAVLCLVNFL